MNGEITDLPEGWARTTLGEVTTLQRGYDLPVQDRQEGSVPVLGGNGKVGTHHVAMVVGPGVVTGRSGTIGKVHVVECDFWPLNTTLFVSDFHGNDPKFSACLLQYLDLEKYHAGTGVPTLNRNVVHEVEVIFPPLAEQRRIVAAVDRILAEVGAARERLGRVPATLKRFRQSVLAAACSGRLTAEWRDDTPWQETALVELLVEKPRNGSSPKGVVGPTPVKSLTLTATTSGVFKPVHFKYLDIEVPPDSYLWLQPGDLLIQRSNTAEYVGVSAIYEGEPSGYVFPDLMMKMRAREGVDPRFLWCALSDEKTRDYFRASATGTAGSMPKINQGIVCATKINLPPLPEQREIVRRVSALFALADGIEAKLAAARRRVDALTRAVLAKAFRGELVPTEAELARREGRDYEPASALLERVRAGRAATPKRRRG